MENPKSKKKTEIPTENSLILKMAKSISGSFDKSSESIYKRKENTEIIVK